jgi:hypothetical protein
MGLYINPPQESKETFLDQYGRMITLRDFQSFDLTSKEVPVCLVDNGPFTAAAIAYSKMEIAAFTDPTDYRLKEYWAVPVECITEELSGVSPAELAKYQKYAR